MANFHAFVIGVDDYEEGFSPLKSPSRDAIELVNVLREAGPRKYSVKLFLNGSSRDIRKAFEQACGSMGNDDCLIFYYSGHGYMDSVGEFYMCASDTDPNLSRSTALSGRFVSDVMNDSGCGKQLMILDCCHSGSFACSLDSIYLGAERFIITSSSLGGNSYGSCEGSGLYSSEFTRLLIESIKFERARIELKEVSIFNVYRRVYDEFSSGFVDQVPYLWVFGSKGDLLIP